VIGKVIRVYGARSLENLVLSCFIIVIKQSQITQKQFFWLCDLMTQPVLCDIL
jgi:hypothetical protein